MRRCLSGNRVKGKREHLEKPDKQANQALKLQELTIPILVPIFIDNHHLQLDFLQKTTPISLENRLIH